MLFNPDPVSLINLTFCIAVVILSVWWCRKTGSRTPLFVGLAFGLFGISHILVLTNLNKTFEQFQIAVRIAAYAIVAAGLFFIALEVMKRRKAEDDLMDANEELRTTNEQLHRSGTELRHNVEELQRKRGELAESEEKFRSIYNTLIDLYFQTDLDGTILMMSPSLKTTTGWEPEELIGTNVRDLYADEHQRTALITELLKHGAVRDYLVRLKNKEGRFIDASLNCHIVPDEAGNPLRIEGTIRDVTDRKIAEDALLLAKKKLNLLNTVTFQDIQNAVFSLNGYFQLQQQHLPDNVRQEYLEKEMAILSTISDSLKFAGQY